MSSSFLVRRYSFRPAAIRSLVTKITTRSRVKLRSPGKGSQPSAKILIHAINYAPELIGCAKYTTELAQYLHSRGHQVEVVAAPPHYPGWYVREPYRALAYVSELLDGSSSPAARC